MGMRACLLRMTLAASKLSHAQNKSLSSTGREGAQRDTGWTPQAINSTTTRYLPSENLEKSKGPETAAEKFKMTDWLCEAKPILHNGLALRSKAYPSKWIGFAKQSQSIIKKGFAKQSPSIMMERLCEAKPIHHDGSALRSKATQSK